MTPNSFGELFRITSFGESHGGALGVVVEGLPSNMPIDLELLRQMLDRRRPGTGVAVSARQESDLIEILSGDFEGKTLGTPVTLIVRNQDQRSEDYDKIKSEARPGHADQAWKDKFGFTDHRGGGRSSGRETVARVIGGAFARMYLQSRIPDLKVQSFLRQVGPLIQPDAMVSFNSNYGILPERWTEIENFLSQGKVEGQSYGGIGEVWIDGLPKGLGEPVFMKLKAQLAGAIMSIGATQGFEIDDGFSVVDLKGTDLAQMSRGDSGGISTGDRIMARAAFKPTSSVLDIAKQGRHDPCIVPRALVVMESMCWLVLANLWKYQSANR